MRKQEKCNRCYWKWFSRKPNPVACPKCHSPFWNKKRVYNVTGKSKENKSSIFVLRKRIVSSGCTASNYIFYREEGKVKKFDNFIEAKKKAKEECASIYKLKSHSYGGINKRENLEHCGNYNAYGEWNE